MNIYYKFEEKKRITNQDLNDLFFWVCLSVFNLGFNIEI